MPGTRGKNTMAEALQSLLPEISFMKTLPDADLQFLLDLETVILKKLRTPLEEMMGQMDGQLPPSSSSGVPSDTTGMPGTPPLPPVGGGVPGIRQSPQLPNPDELRRMIGANTQ